jgi:hypothetical protein
LRRILAVGKLAFTVGLGQKPRLRTIPARDLATKRAAMAFGCIDF